MKRLVSLFAVLLAVVALAACRARENHAAGSTETIAPAQPKPAATDSDALTQTVDVEGGRSEAEGAALTERSTAEIPPQTTSSATTTTTTTRTTTTPPTKQ